MNTIKKLPDICTIKTGKMDANHATSNGKYRFYTCASQYCYCDTKSFSGPSVIVPGNGDIGLVFYYDGEFEAYQRTYVLSDIKIYPKYLYYHMVYKWRYINSGKQYGSTVRYVRMGNFSNYEIPIPELAIQKKIVIQIEESLSQLDSAVEMLKKTKQHLEIYRQAVLKEAFDFDNVDKTVELSEIVSDIRIGPFGTMLHKSDYIIGGVPVINPQHIKSGTIVPSEKISIIEEKSIELRNYALRTNDIVMGRRGEMGRTAPVTDKEKGWICGTGSIILRLKPDYDALLYSKLLSSPNAVHYLEENATGTTMKNLNEEIVSHLPVPNIDKSTQRKIMQSLDEQLSVCSIIDDINLSLQYAEALRQSILKQAFEEV